MNWLSRTLSTNLPGIGGRAEDKTSRGVASFVAGAEDVSDSGVATEIVELHPAATDDMIGMPARASETDVGVPEEI